jgi:3-phosphoshikimate 1-carboxyvinyltransferase
MAEELKKMDIDIEELPDGLIIGGGKPKPTELHGWADHRIVMALSLAGLNLDAQCTIDTAEAISVTFPNYVELMNNINANMELVSA